MSRIETIGNATLGRSNIRVLVACEYSATVRDAFRARGFDAWSCDLLSTEGDPGGHIVGDVQKILKRSFWDLIVMHVPCTEMGVCGNGTYGRGKLKHHERERAIDWTLETVQLALASAECVALENPASVIFPYLRDQYDCGVDVQYVQPWQHGHPEQKKTGLALFDLPRLSETGNVYEHMMTLPRAERERVFFMSPGADRGKERARFYPGIAAAMAEQWGDYLLSRRRSLAA